MNQVSIFINYYLILLDLNMGGWRTVNFWTQLDPKHNSPYHQLWVVGVVYLNYQLHMGWKHNCPLLLLKLHSTEALCNSPMASVINSAPKVTVFLCFLSCFSHFLSSPKWVLAQSSPVFACNVENNPTLGQFGFCNIDKSVGYRQTLETNNLAIEIFK